MDEDTLAFAEVLMKRTSQNIQNNGKLAILAEEGKESYLVNAINPQRHTDGEIYNELVSKFAFLNMPIAAVWTCEINKIFNQGGNAEAGTQLY